MTIQTILFDIDGVLLSEEGYFDASALTVWELLVSPFYLGLTLPELPAFTTKPTRTMVKRIRSVLFAEERVLQYMKQVGINSNWDFVYLQLMSLMQSMLPNSQGSVRPDLPPVWDADALESFRSQLTPETVSYSYMLHQFAGEVEQAADLFHALSAAFDAGQTNTAPSDLQSLWQLCKVVFDEWYLGNEQSGKIGFIFQEEAIVDPVTFKELLQKLKQRGIRLGIGTGRQQVETVTPLTEFGWLQYFHSERVSTATDVLAAEACVPKARPLSKPNPFSYVRSYLGTNDAREVIQTPLPLPMDVGSSVLVVGDSVADWMAARAAGFRFAAVLTGLTGQAARAQFEELGCDWILNHVLEVETLMSEK